MSARSVPFADTTTNEIAAGARLALVPVGAIEQHGPHLPLGTDTILATAVAAAIVDRTDGTVLGPVLAFGCSSHHVAFPGTVSLRASTFVAAVVDVCRSLTAAGLRVVLINGHGGNRAPLQISLMELADEGIRAYAFTYWELLTDVVADVFGDDAPTACGHACALETSLMQHLHPQLVRESLIPSGATPDAWPDPHMFSADVVRVVRPFQELNPSGVIGRPSLATPEIGRILFLAAAERGASEVIAIQRIVE